MRVTWSPAAVRHLEEIRVYIRGDSPRAAEATVRRIRDAASMLAQHPEIGRVGRVLGTRELVVSGTPYLLPYRIAEDRIDILQVRHGAQEWPKTF